jgi:hypothetical protein
VIAVEPLSGRFAAVALETPIILAVSWVASGFLIRRLDVSQKLTARLLMGGSAFVLLITAEVSLSVFVFGLSASAFAAGLIQPAGLLGLTAQLVFAAMPALGLIGGERR